MTGGLVSVVENYSIIKSGFLMYDISFDQPRPNNPTVILKISKLDDLSDEPIFQSMMLNFGYSLKSNIIDITSFYPNGISKITDETFDYIGQGVGSQVLGNIFNYAYSNDISILKTRYKGESLSKKTFWDRMDFTKDEKNKEQKGILYFKLIK